MADPVLFFRLKAPPANWVPNGIYFIRPDGQDRADQYVVSNTGEPTLVGVVEADLPKPADLAAYEHKQADASVTWTVNHNLGRAPAAVTILTPGGLEVLADVVHLSVNQLVVRLAAPASGRVIVL